MSDMRDLLKIKTFLASERQAVKTLSPPDDFAQRVQQLAADYTLRQQASEDMRALPTPSPAAIAPPQRRPAELHRPKRRLPSPLAASVVVAALIICAISLSLPSGVSFSEHFSGLIEIKAAYAAGGGIDVNQGFIISASQPISAELVEKGLRVHPRFNYQLEAEEENTYRVVPLEPLAENTIYTLSFDPERAQEQQPLRPEYSWSFQTEAAFALVDISPTDTAEQVPAQALLVLSFNRAVTAEAAAMIMIEPQRAGQWQAGDNSLVFQPQTEWEYGVSYRVVLPEDFPAEDGALLGQAYISHFTVESPPVLEFMFALEAENDSMALSPDQAPGWRIKELSEQSADDGSPYLAQIYRLPDFHAFGGALAKQQLEPLPLDLDVTELELWQEYELASPEEQEAILSLPESLPPGFYLAQLSKQECRQQDLLQVSGLSAYVAAGPEDSLLWLHKADGAPAAGARVWLWPEGITLAETDQSGLALLRQSDKHLAGGTIYCVQTEEESLLLADFSQPPPLEEQETFSYYLYTDQDIYAPGQKVNFFGVYQRNWGKASLSREDNPPALYVALKGMGMEQKMPYQAEVTEGAFSGALTLPGLLFGWYELALYAGESYVGGRYIRVEPEQPYQLSIRPAQQEAFAGDTLEWLVEASYQHNIPLAGLPVRVEDLSSGLSIDLLTDQQGQASFSWLASPLMLAQAVFPAQGEQSALGSLIVLETQGEESAIGGTLEAGALEAGALEAETPEVDQEHQPLYLLVNQESSGAGEQYYRAGQPVELMLYRGDEPLQPVEGGHSLFVLSGSQVLAAEAASQAFASLQGEGDYPATFFGWAVYYQDGQYFTSKPLTLAGQEKPEVILSAQWLAAEEESGDETRRLSLRLSDGEGQPLAATLNLNMLTAGSAMESDFAHALSQQGDHFAYREYFSHQRRAGEDEQIPAASVRTGTQEGVSEQSSGLFITISTDEEGLAELELIPPQGGFQLNWHAYAPQLWLAAAGSLEVPEPDELRLLTHFDDSFVTGDAPVLRVKADGAKLSSGATLRYEISVEELDFRQRFNGRAGEWHEIALPELPGGEYQLRLSVAGGRERLTRLLDFSVGESGASYYQLSQQPLKAGLSLSGEGEQELTLVFSDGDKAAVVDELFRLANQDTVRLWQRLAALLAERVLEQQFQWPHRDDQDINLMLYQRGDGGLAPLPQAAANRKLSALAAPLLGGELDRQALAVYLRAWYDQAEHDFEQALALYGLAALEQPVLLDMENLLADEPSFMAQLYVALAYMACGDGAVAKDLTLELLAAYCKESAQGLPVIAPSEGLNPAELAEATAHLALLANTFDLPQADDLYAIMREDDDPGMAQVLAEAQILLMRCYRLPANAYFSYRLKGQTHRVSLREYGHYSLTLSREQLADLSFSNLAGNIVVSSIAYRQGLPAVEGLEEPTAGAEIMPQISRYYQPQSMALGELGLQEIILEISLPQDAPAGYYRIDDTLPAGLHFGALDSFASSRRVWLLEAGDSTVSFNIYKGEGEYQASVVYTAMVKTPGSYLAEAPRIYAALRREGAGQGLSQQIDLK